MKGDGFIDTEDDSRGVEQEEHEDGEDKNQGKIGICLLMMQPLLNAFIACKIELLTYLITYLNDN